MKKVVAVLVAVVVGAVVIYGGVTLYGMRHQLFRPDVASAGGTEIAFGLAEPADPAVIDRACEVLRKRFDGEGRAGVAVSREGDDRLTITVPNGRKHDDLVGQARRLTCARGRFEFRLVANEDADLTALTQAEASFPSMKDLPARPGDLGGALTVEERGERIGYRWCRVSDGMARHWNDLHPTSALPVRAGKGSRHTLATSYNVRLFVAEAPGKPVEYFALCRDPRDGEPLGPGGIERVRLAGRSARQMATIEFTFDEPTAQRLRVLSAPLVSAPFMRGRGVHFLAGILDGEVVLGQQIHAPIRRKEQFSAWLLASEAEDLTALLRGGELPVKLDPKSLAERTVAPRR